MDMLLWGLTMRDMGVPWELAVTSKNLTTLLTTASVSSNLYVASYIDIQNNRKFYEYINIC